METIHNKLDDLWLLRERLDEDIKARKKDGLKYAYISLNVSLDRAYSILESLDAAIKELALKHTIVEER